MKQSTTFNSSMPFTVYEQPHQGNLRTWKCADANDFVAKVSASEYHRPSFQEFEEEFEIYDDDGDYVRSTLSGGDWNAVRKYLASDLQYCVLEND